MGANDTQVGGTHYKNPFQHWDLAAELRLGYFEGQVSKYVTRHRFKKGREDAEKALHFCRKMLELYDGPMTLIPMRRTLPPYRLAEYSAANRLTPLESNCLFCLLNWSRRSDLVVLEELLLELVTTYDGDASSAYVRQEGDKS